ncbi:MAG: hypothetical protein K2X47_15865, partial [Bdellovibrionales bacterium]|nr:hypothetical protein [Bdellovibrionales bacterium]
MLIGFTQGFLRIRNRKHFAKLKPWSLGFAQELQISDATVFVQKSFEGLPQVRPVLFLHGLG